MEMDMSTRHTQPEALRLAEAMNTANVPFEVKCDTAAELRRLHALNGELLRELQTARREIAALHQAFVATVTNQSTGQIDDYDDALTVQADRDFLAGIDAAIAKATSTQG